MSAVHIDTGNGTILILNSDHVTAMEITPGTLKIMLTNMNPGEPIIITAAEKRIWHIANSIQSAINENHA